MKPTDLAAEVDEQIGRRLHDVGVDCPCDFVDIIQSAIEKDREQNREWAESLTKLCNEPWLKKLLKSRAAHASEQGAESLLDWAWTILANAGGGDWTKESKDWQEAVVKWRDEYHKNLSARQKVDPQCNLPRKPAHASEPKDHPPYFPHRDMGLLEVGKATEK